MEIASGSILTNACEINAVMHCNLSCRSCSHRSPTLRKRYVEPELVNRDLKIVGKYVSPKMVRVVGGEPLLHPQIDILLEAIRDAEICDWLRVVTNGVLLNKASPAFWQLVDEVYISHYPGFHLDDDSYKSISRKAAEAKVVLQVNVMDTFREATALLGTSNSILKSRIFHSCRIAHSWQCHTVHEGFYFLCPQSLFHWLTATDKSPIPLDAVKLEDGDSLYDNLKQLISRRNPLDACTTCLGNAGKRFPHAQVSRRDWENYSRFSTEDLLDENILRRLENDPNYHAD
jgi:GTP 3',8-cyclase